VLVPLLSAHACVSRRKDNITTWAHALPTCYPRTSPNGMSEWARLPGGEDPAMRRKRFTEEQIIGSISRCACSSVIRPADL